MQNSPATASPGKTLTERVLYAGYWSLLGNVATKILGGVKTIVLARLLLPEDFGLVGLALVCIGTANTFSYPGIYTALIQKQDLDDSSLNAGWWIHAIRGALLFLAMLMAAGAIADFYGDPRVAPVLQVTSLTFLLNGFQSIGLVRLNRTLNLKRLTLLNQIANLFSFAVGVGLALALRNVWALVAAHLAQWLGMFVMSHIMEPFPPRARIPLYRVRELLHFGGFLFLITIPLLLFMRGSDFLLPKEVGLEAYGYFALAASLVGILFQVNESALSAISLPALSEIREDLQRLKRAFLRLFRVTLVISIVLSGGLAIFARDAIELVLGSKWIPMYGSLILLVFYRWFHGLGLTLQSLHVALGKVQDHAKIRFLQLLVFAIGILPCVRLWGARGAAGWLLVVSAASFLALLWLTRRYVAGLPESVLLMMVRYWPLFATQAVLAVLVWTYGSGWLTTSAWVLVYLVTAAAIVIFREQELLNDLLRTMARGSQPEVPVETF